MNIDLKEFFNQREKGVKIYSFIRFSDRSQEKEGGGQEYKIKTFMNLMRIYNWEEKIITLRGSKTGVKDFTIFDQGSIIVTTELSRIARSLKNLMDIMGVIEQRKLSIIFCGDDSTKNIFKGNIDQEIKLFMSIRGAIAEYERKLNLNRLSEGMAAWKSRLGTEGLKDHYKNRKVSEKKTYTLTEEEKKRITYEIELGVSKFKIWKRLFSGTTRPTYNTFLKMICRASLLVK